MTRDADEEEEEAARRACFEEASKVIKQELFDYVTGEGMPKDAIEWYDRTNPSDRTLTTTSPGGKLNRDIIEGTPLTVDEYLKAAVLGWGIELVFSDDMMDSSMTRRGQPYWYRVPYVGQIALNDSVFVESYYVDILELFLETTFQTEMGQLINWITGPEDEVGLSKFSQKKHSLIVIYKTACYSFYLPVALTMYMSHVPQSYASGNNQTIKPCTLRLAKSILIPFSEFFRIQDDFLDFSGTPEQIRKIGTDILDNKCSWCVNTALVVCTPEQRKNLDEKYERKESVRERRVKEVFESPEVDLKKWYGVYEERFYGELAGMTGEISVVEARGTYGGCVGTQRDLP
ncbi:isoprenoid synthase domain-containing protein [Armillaria mellea]|nr:isoprenoid synthase domain-containing protein [Armillaria mellea]